ncbi:MAG: ATPase [Alkalicoccus sp.]|nr:MAG: ATPase [Alkalicoccus sp.]
MIKKGAFLLMDVLTLLIINFLIISLLLIVLAAVYRNKTKKDKGVVFNYFKLSYRRKLIRTWISLPFTLIVLILLYIITDWTEQLYIALGILLFASFIIQLLYNYVQWKKEETSD